MRVALVYDLRDDYRALGFSEEEVAEFMNRDRPSPLAPDSDDPSTGQGGSG